MSYREFLELQSQAFEQGAVQLHLAELQPVVTLGRRTDFQEFESRIADIESQGVSVERVSRGGKMTYHGPGQWVLFPVLHVTDLGTHPKDVQVVVCQLLKLLRSVVESFSVTCEVRAGEEMGIWANGGKLGSIGIQVSENRVTHGAALNVFSTPQSFYGIQPCGLSAQPAYLWELAGEPGPKESFFKKVGERFREFTHLLERPSEIALR